MSLGALEAAIDAVDGLLGLAAGATVPLSAFILDLVDLPGAADTSSCLSSGSDDGCAGLAFDFRAVFFCAGVADGGL